MAVHQSSSFMWRKCFEHFFAPGKCTLLWREKKEMFISHDLNYFSFFVAKYCVWFFILSIRDCKIVVQCSVLMCDQCMCEFTSVLACERHVCVCLSTPVCNQLMCARMSETCIFCKFVFIIKKSSSSRSIMLTYFWFCQYNKVHGSRIRLIILCNNYQITSCFVVVAVFLLSPTLQALINFPHGSSLSLTRSLSLPPLHLTETRLYFSVETIIRLLHRAWTICGRTKLCTL